MTSAQLAALAKRWSSWDVSVGTHDSGSVDRDIHELAQGYLSAAQSLDELRRLVGESLAADDALAAMRLSRGIGHNPPSAWELEQAESRAHAATCALRASVTKEQQP